MRDELVLDFRLARRGFDAAAASYESAAVLYAEVAGQLLERLHFMRLAPTLVVDAGCGTGLATRRLKQRYGDAKVVALDYSPAMLAHARRRRGFFRRYAPLCADAARLPLKDGSVDLLFSNLMLPWCDPDAVLGEFRRVLAAQGLLTFTSFGPDTLRELREAWRAVDTRPHVHAFLDMHDLGDALVRNGFAAPVLDVERFTLSYAHTDALFKDLAAVGARNRLKARTQGLTTPRRLTRLRSAYEAFRRDGRLPASYEVVFAHAWAPNAAPGVRGGNTVSLEQMRQKLKQRRGGGGR